MLGSERMNAKIRQAQQMKVPYMLIVGDQEVAEESVAVRERDGRQQHNISVAAFMEHVRGGDGRLGDGRLAHP